MGLCAQFVALRIQLACKVHVYDAHHSFSVRSLSMEAKTNEERKKKKTYREKKVQKKSTFMHFNQQ